MRRTLLRPPKEGSCCAALGRAGTGAAACCKRGERERGGPAAPGASRRCRGGPCGAISPSQPRLGPSPSRHNLGVSPLPQPIRGQAAPKPRPPFPTLHFSMEPPAHRPPWGSPRRNADPPQFRRCVTPGTKHPLVPASRCIPPAHGQLSLGWLRRNAGEKFPLLRLSASAGCFCLAGGSSVSSGRGTGMLDPWVSGPRHQPGPGEPEPTEPTPGTGQAANSHFLPPICPR